MAKLTDRIAALPHDANYFSLEFFPPKTQIGFSNLQTRLERMSSALRPLFVTVTWGAGGTTASRSLELAEICQRQLGLTTCLHLTCTNMKRDIVDSALEEARVLGIRNILALRGDAPRGDEYGIEDGIDDDQGSNKDFTWAIDLVRYIRRKHGDFFCIGVAGYPEGHSDLSHPNDQDVTSDLPYLVEKVEAGADFVMTQLFYDASSFLSYERILRDHPSGVFKNIPIIPGLMPVQNFANLKRVAQLAHAKLPNELLSELEPLRGDDEAVKRVGVDALCRIVDTIRDSKQSSPRGFHFYTLNLEKAVSDILERCQLIPLEDAVEIEIPHIPLTNGFGGEGHQKARTMSSSSAKAAAQLTTDSHRPSSNDRPAAQVPSDSKPPSHEATWDDFPNGRFGDARSPAFNAPLTYSMTSFNVSPAQSIVLWGTPTSPADITQLFTSHLLNYQPLRLPWSETATISPETALIQNELAHLTGTHGFWTLASQPAVDGIPSEHSVHGWGPPGGFVFQKAFVEFFVLASTFHEQLKPRLRQLASEAEISWYATTASGAFESSETSSATHAVTWGSFKGKEIATATMVEEMSFKTWGEEAFGIWGEWGRVIGEVARELRTEDTRKPELRRCRDFLMKMRRETVLVNVIGHDYKNAGSLWEHLQK